ncbi:MAG: hemolysin III family protein [Candidatus Onthovivens sp.]|nr:hemolysin III family protein [Candidatus Onthovivens sp.]
MCVDDIKLPNYKLKHELCNSITHGLGAIFGILATIFMYLKICGVFPQSEVDYDIDFIYRCIGVGIYGFGMITCMCISCLYHALARNKGKKVFRVIDHDFVFVLLAGTYSIYCLCAIRNTSIWNNLIPYSGWIIFVIVWLLVILGIIFNSINIHRYSKLCMIIYIVAGWTILFASDGIIKEVGINGFLLLLFGGIAYTIGAILYGLGKKKSVWFHTVFHCFVIVGMILQFVSVYLYVL